MSPEQDPSRGQGFERLQTNQLRNLAETAMSDETLDRVARILSRRASRQARSKPDEVMRLEAEHALHALANRRILLSQILNDQAIIDELENVIELPDAPDAETEENARIDLFKHEQQ